MLIELDGCEIRTGTFAPSEGDLQDGQPNRTKILAWRDVRVGLARPMSAESKLYVAQMEKYPEVMSQLFSVATMLGMSEQTDVVAVADGGQGLREGLENQFPNMQFILDKPHLKKHLYETAAALGYNEEQQRQWVHAKLDRISEGHAEEVLKELEVQNTTEPNDRLRQFIGLSEPVPGCSGLRSVQRCDLRQRFNFHDLECITNRLHFSVRCNGFSLH